MFKRWSEDIGTLCKVCCCSFFRVVCYSLFWKPKAPFLTSDSLTLSTEKMGERHTPLIWDPLLLGKSARSSPGMAGDASKTESSK